MAVVAAASLRGSFSGSILGRRHCHHQEIRTGKNCTGNFRVRWRSPLHFCGHDGCHDSFGRTMDGVSTVFDDDEALRVENLEHLPVCHELCWRLEVERFRRERPHLIDWCELPLCHRTCYCTALRRESHPAGGYIEVSPLNRTMKERLKDYKCQHVWEWFRQKPVRERLRQLKQHPPTLDEVQLRWQAHWDLQPYPTNDQASEQQSTSSTLHQFVPRSGSYIASRISLREKPEASDPSIERRDWAHGSKLPSRQLRRPVISQELGPRVIIEVHRHEFDCEDRCTRRPRNARRGRDDRSRSMPPMARSRSLPTVRE
ncbi:hypothetical protein M433DRAFT_423102 [Acidomyces richmondensis BFW]|nr:hypothetical protein M433DRAFT_423102 [Acidomyces richmondensis BFW]